MKRWHFFEEFKVYRYGRAKSTVLAVNTSQRGYRRYLNTDFIPCLRGALRRVSLDAMWCFPGERLPMVGKIDGHYLRIRFERISRKRAFRKYPRLSAFLNAIR